MKTAFSWKAALAAALMAAAAQGQVTLTQTITLHYGWNAVYLELAPLVPLEEVFADWPVKSVGFYDPASFLATRQFSQTWDSLGVSMRPIATWHRDYPEVSQVERIPAGTVFETVPDRRSAIRRACTLAGPEDMILISGKGHESYQEINGEKFPFSDAEELARCFKEEEMKK